MADTLDSDRDKRDAEIVDRHLPDGYSASPDIVASSLEGTSTPASESSSQQQPVLDSLSLQGGDMHRDIFKIQARAVRPQRSNTFTANESPRLKPANYQTVAEQRQPQGFRREYVQQRALHRSHTAPTGPATRSFISFLELYGSFAGEDLEDIDSDEESAVEDDDEAGPSENQPLLGKKKKRRSRRLPTGDAGLTKTFFTLLKAFIGTGIMFLPKAFRNGGILFSSITLITVSVLTTICFRLLLEARLKYGGGGYGELGEVIVGSKMRSVILASITLSQLGFVCAGMIFVAENLRAFLDAVFWYQKHTTQPLGVTSLIVVQFAVLIPLALVRNISKLGPYALLADVFILAGVGYIWYYDIASLISRGIAPSVVKFNSAAFTLTIGSSIFTFEGIGLILPIQSSMKQPEKFSYLLYLVMLIITIIFTSVGALCYATFGDETKIQVISNFPADSPLVNTIQCLYSLAVLVGNPVQLFPATRIIETSLFGGKASGKKSKPIKWKKNALRSGLMILCGGISIVGASDLDKFVALIGAFACVPLVYIYPPFLHYRGMAETRVEKGFDALLIAVGVIAMAYSSVMVVVQWVNPQ